MDALLADDHAFRPLQYGDLLEGVVVQVTPHQIMIDVGHKTDGLLSARELERMDPEVRQSLKVGDKVLAYVLKPEDGDGNLILSLARAKLEEDWRDLESNLGPEQILEAEISSYNKGGLIVNFGRVRGFVPASQLASLPPPGDENESRESRLAAMVGQRLRLKIIDMDRTSNRLILSERAVVEEMRRQRRDQLLDELQEGEVRQGRVSNLTNFGAFVDLGGADGLIHLSELSWGRVSHPEEVLQVGDEVEVYVLRLDRENSRIALSLKRLRPEPWSTVDERYTVGQLVQATVTKITSYGAFARLVDDEIEGLIHISELSEEPIAHPKEAVKVGDLLTLRIIRIDKARRRLGLSLRRVEDHLDAYEDEEKEVTKDPSEKDVSS